MDLQGEFELSVGDMLVANPSVPAEGPNVPFARSVYVVTGYYPETGMVQAVNITQPDADFAAEIEHEMIDAAIPGESFNAAKVYKGGPRAGTLTVVNAIEYDELTGEASPPDQNIYALSLSPAETAASFGHVEKMFAADGVFETPRGTLHRQIETNFWKVLKYREDIVFGTAPEDRYLAAAQLAGWDMTSEMH